VPLGRGKDAVRQRMAVPQAKKLKNEERSEPMIYTVLLF
jgi:hypothetical protein